MMVGGVYLDFGLNLAQLSSGQHLYVRADLFSRSRLARSQLNVTGNQLISTCKYRRKKSRKLDRSTTPTVDDIIA